MCFKQPADFSSVQMVNFQFKYQERQRALTGVNPLLKDGREHSTSRDHIHERDPNSLS